MPSIQHQQPRPKVEQDCRCHQATDRMVAQVLFHYLGEGNQHEANRPLAGDPVCLRHGDNASRHAPLASCRKPWLVLSLLEEMQEEFITSLLPTKNRKHI